MWPGYLSTTRLLRDGIFLNVDTVSKFVQDRTILDFINELKQHKRDYICSLFDSSIESMPRRTVLTKYNTRTYQVDGLTYDKTPKNYYFEWNMKTKEGLQKFNTNLIDYMLRVYKIDVTKPDQPLLFVNVKNQMGEPQTIYLIP